MSNWKVSISELIKILQGALVALVPWLKSAKIPISSNNSYDDYDEIADVLFRRIVKASIENDLSGFEDLAVYGMHIKSYKCHSFLLAKFPDSNEDMISFIEFRFDLKHNILARIALLNENLSVKEFQTRDCSEMTLELARNKKGVISTIHEIEVEL